MASSLITLLIGGVILIGGAWCFMAGPCKGMLSGLGGGGDGGGGSGQQPAATPPDPPLATPPTSGTPPDPTLPPPTPIQGTPSVELTPKVRLSTLQAGLKASDPKLLADKNVTTALAAYMADLKKGHYNPALRNNLLKAMCNSNFCKKNPKNADCVACKSSQIKPLITSTSPTKKSHYARLSGV